MPEKFEKVLITVENGDVYSVQAHDIAHDRAAFYEKRDKTTTYGEEYDFAISDRSELLDWLFGNMDWDTMNPKLEEKAPAKKLRDMEVIDTEVK